MAELLGSDGPKRGRPAGSKNKPKPKNGAEAARLAEQMVGGAFVKKDDDGFAPVQGLGEDTRTAPAFGANEPDVTCFLKHVKILRDHDELERKAKAEVKRLNKIKKDLRTAAKEQGIVLGELDRALKDADTENVDLVAREKRYMLYMEWLGKPLDYQAAMPVSADQTPERVAKYWFNRGEQLGRLGKERKQPEGCPPENIQDVLKGYDHGQELLMRKSPLTADAFNDQPAKAPAPAAPETMVSFGPEHFYGGVELEDANLKTLLEEHHDRFNAAENVVAVFGASKRVLKEPGYVDTGEEDVPVTDPEPLAEELA